MDKQQFLSVFEELIEADPGTVQFDNELTQLQRWDSLAFVGLIALADEHWDAQLVPTALQKCKTVGDIAFLVDGQGQRRAA